VTRDEMEAEVERRALQFGQRELVRINKGHRRAMRWLKAHQGQKPTKAIQHLLHEYHALAELKMAQQDNRLREEYEKEAASNPAAIPPLPKGRPVAVTNRQAVALLAALKAESAAEGI
jgi:hypothetical protein